MYLLKNEKVRQFIRSQGQIFSENKWSKISWHCTFKWANPMTLHLYEPIPWLCMNEFLWLKARGFGEKQRFWSSCTSNRLTHIYLSPECIYDTQFQNLKNVLKHLWKHHCFINLKSCICIKTILWTRNTNCFTIFVHRNFRRKGHSKLWVSYSPTAM